MSAVAARAGFVARTDVEQARRAYAELLRATAARAWSQGLYDGAQAMHHALEREGLRPAEAAARGLLHDQRSDADRAPVVVAAAGVQRALGRLTDLGSIMPLRDYQPGDDGDPSYAALVEELIPETRASDETVASLVRQGRWFLLRWGQGLAEDEAYAKLDK